MIRTMNKRLIDRLNLLLDKSGKSAQRVSIEATGAKDTLRKILDGTSKNPRSDTLAKIAHVLDTTTAYLMGEESPDLPSTPASRDVSTAPSSPQLPPRQSMPLDVPVMGTAAGSLERGAFQFDGGVVDYVRRPPALSGARDIYALYVEGTSMEPQYHAGDLVYVNPHRPARVGDIVVVQCRNGDHSPSEASLGIYRRRTEKVFILGKRNPSSDIELNREHISAIHRVLTTNELFGV